VRAKRDSLVIKGHRNSISLAHLVNKNRKSKEVAENKIIGAEYDGLKIA
jgi:hypothetical protein